MIYTIGYFPAYSKTWLESGEVIKTGQRPDFISERYPHGYPGGIVWQTPADALAFLEAQGLEDYAVWPLECEWDNTYAGFYEDTSTHSLLEDARLAPFAPFPF